MHSLPTRAITCCPQVAQRRPLPASSQTLQHPSHCSQDSRLYNEGQHPQAVVWEDRVGHWGKLSYKQGGTVLKGVTWRGGDISIPGGAGCPPPVLVALEKSHGPSWAACQGLSLGSCCVGDADGPAAPSGLPFLPPQLRSPQVPTVDRIWMISLNSPCYIPQLPRKHSAHPGETPRSGQLCAW